MKCWANTPVLEAMGATFKLIVMAYIVRMPFGFENLSGLDRGVATGMKSESDRRSLLL